jgi:opacity protein-like surface antigen
MLKTKILAVLGAFLMSASVASAADMLVDIPAPVIPPSVPATHDWSGWYIGGYAGYLWGDFTHDWPQPGLSGLDAGVEVHYNAVSGPWVLSPFVAATIPTQKSVIAGLVPVNVQWAAQAGLRLGYAIDRWLPYVYGGGVIGSAYAGNFVNESQTHFGYIVGAGIEYAVDDSWTVGVRYAFYDLGPQDYTGGGRVGWQGSSILGTISFKLH